ncbi:hypothetical protein FIU88_05625 [Halomonas sp. THAF12]|uniref:hypothetical protein n=1 Tax=Halomonas sp. THAF12 TaxID=2587849 RepID=UPI00126983BC|nr:hypothetical protein [Halomonas sp. THAF12]QFT84458.1 hypothetical protein FIU88_05625 [Halomonas sp. THAF12]
MSDKSQVITDPIAADILANRTAYSLAREVLGLRTALEEARADLDGVAAQFGEIGRLVPTDYQDRSELFGALLRIIQKVPSGARARAEASALRRYAMRLHEQHDWRDHLLVEADRIEQNAKELNKGEAS